ncbi:MAG: hypothetical protein WCV59_03385 [Parcubacteria group bacterium]|jgi:hypothetical protein
MDNSGLKLLLYFGYGAMLKGLCSDGVNEDFHQKALKYFDGDSSLENDIADDVYVEFPHATRRLIEMSREKNIDRFSGENVHSYVYEIHGREVLPSCAVLSGRVKNVFSDKKIVEIERDKEIFEINYLLSLESTFSIGDEVYFHQGWLIPKK